VYTLMPRFGSSSARIRMPRLFLLSMKCYLVLLRQSSFLDSYSDNMLSFFLTGICSLPDSREIKSLYNLQRMTIVNQCC
jgi:hypothetical protein